MQWFMTKSLKQINLLWVLIPTVFILLSYSAECATVKVEWDPSPTPEVKGYVVYYGTSSGNYITGIDVGDRTIYNITDLKEGQTYYFTATSYVSENLESDFCNEINYIVPYADTDGDGISDYNEVNSYGTDPSRADTDGDGLSDSEELAYWGNNWDADSDNDGLINLVDPDSDNDGLIDASEIDQGSDPERADQKIAEVRMWIEAEQGDIYDPMLTGSDDNASGGEYISATTGGYAEYSFEVPAAGNYYVWGRTIGATGGSNSFFIAADNGGDIAWHLPISVEWNWSQAVSIYLEAGQHTLIVSRRENNAQLDKILITNDSKYVPQGFGVEDMQLWIEAEQGDLYDPMQIGSDGNASDGEYISATTGGYAEYSFDVPVAGTYYVWGRTIGATGGSNSFFIAADNGGDMAWHLPISMEWNWSQAVSIYLEAGQHTLIVSRRENNAQLDKILITNDSKYVPQGFGVEDMQLWIEAELGDLYESMQTESDGNASGGKYISATTDGYAEYAIEITEPAAYFIWGRTIGPTAGSDSFYIATDNGGDIAWHLPISEDWSWNRAISVYFEAAHHILTIKHRENGAMLDKILISKDSDFIPSEKEM